MKLPVLLALSCLAYASAAHGAPTDAQCDARVNDTADKLLECIRPAPLHGHLAKFQAIADANPDSQGHGNRDTGTNGYKASVDYVAALMERAGYDVTVQPYFFEGSHLVGPPSFATSRRTFAWSVDWEVARLSGSGDVTAPVRPLRGAGAAAGCAPGDFVGFVPGDIALLEVGACSLDDAVANARAAGAAAVIVANRVPGAPALRRRRRDGGAYEGALSEPTDIPVLAVAAHSVGVELSSAFDAGEAPRAHIAVQTAHAPQIDYNLIAESRYGDPDHVVVVDAHLDSIYGAGILDKASGSSTILEIARKLSRTPTANRLRYIWFGGEEINLLGSKFYVRSLAPDALKRVAFDVDVDVTATPNYDYLIADPTFAPNAAKFPAGVVTGSKVGNDAFSAYFAAAGVPTQSARFGNEGTDSNSFALAGVPNTGILTQQDCCKAPWEVSVWGGALGNYEGVIPSFNGGCVDHPRRWCDTLANTDSSVMLTASRAAAFAVLTLANTPVGSPRRVVAERHAPASRLAAR